MFKNISKISGISSRVGKFARTARSKTALAAAIAATTMCLNSTSFGALTPTITSITTKFTAGTSTTAITGVAGAGLASYSVYVPSGTYSEDFSNDVDAITSATAGGNTYNVSGQGTAIIRRDTAFPNNNEMVWEDGTGGTGISTLVMEGPNLGGTASNAVAKALGGNNILIGSDNLFSNFGNPVGDNDNIVRMDMIFPMTISASTSKAFAIYDRGESNDHDAFQLAAITRLDSNGNPSAYGPLLSFADGTWGTTSIVSTQQEDVLRMNNSGSSTAVHPADIDNQPIGGVLVPTTSLGVAAGTTIYGYSMFSPNVTGSGTQLVDWTNQTFFPQANYTSTGGGLDPVGAVALEYTEVAVPEPATASLAMLSIGGYLARRPRRKLAAV